MNDTVRKVRLDKDAAGRVEFGIRHEQSAREIAAVMAECRQHREMEAVLGKNKDSYDREYILPTVLIPMIKRDHGVDAMDPTHRKALDRLVESHYPLLKTTNRRIG